MAKIRYPEKLKKGDKIAVTAPSAGVEASLHRRLDLVLNHLKAQGYEVVEGQCLRESPKHVSAPSLERAQEFLRFWKDPEIKAIMPPWGGELLVDIFQHLDFDEIGRSAPKWVSGYSDISTLLFALTLKTGIATLHGSNLMELAPTQTDPLTKNTMIPMKLDAGEMFEQQASEKYQKTFIDFETQVDAPLNLTEKTRWKVLGVDSKIEFSGRLIGGCLDTIVNLVGTPYGDLPNFVRAHKSDGVIFYFENVELSPCGLARALWNLRLAGWFEGLAGLLIGRSAGPDAKSENQMSYVEALQSVLGNLNLPVLYDLDIGHQQPNLSLVNGAPASVSYSGASGKIQQRLI